MSMKQSIQLKLGQHLTMTPQLQQAIRLLQLSSLELTAEVQDALDSNMMLEVDENSEGSDSDVEVTAAETTTDGESDLYSFEASEEGDPEARGTTEDIPSDMPVDSDWEEVYDSMGAGSTSVRSLESGGAATDFESVQSAETTLIDHLDEQLNLMPLSDTDRAIALILIDSLDEYGYLQVELPAVIEILAEAGIEDVELDEVEAVLKQVNHLDPIGVGARDLGECLLLQLETFDESTKWLKEAREICRHYIDLLGSRNYRQVTRKLRVSEDDLREILGLIQSLNPRPGEVFNDKPPEYVVPDAYVRKIKGKWLVTLNMESLPQLRVNPYYASLIRRADNSSDNSSLKTHLQEAKWFIKSLQSRSDTLLRVATEIVERQQAFLDYGEEAMKPLVLHDIAEALGMHESTISRVTTRKYLHTPRGIYELKYFFSSHVSTTLGGEASSTAIRAVIKKLISAENNSKPLSDSKIANLLSDQGIKVARRTVAKYREAMQIPPSNERKRLA